MKTEEQIKEKLNKWKKEKKSRAKFRQDVYLEAVIIATLEWVLEE